MLRPVSVVIEKDLNSYQSEASGTSQSLWEGKALHKGRFLKIHMNILSLTGIGRKLSGVAVLGNEKYLGLGSLQMPPRIYGK